MPLISIFATLLHLYMAKTFKLKADTLGAFASGLCMIHCLATPFLFVASACTKSCCSAAPAWWKWIDFVFLFISLFAVYRSTLTTTKSWIKTALWLAWGALFCFVLLEQSHEVILSEGFKYTSAFVLIGLHLYNLKFCQCKAGECCTNHE